MGVELADFFIVVGGGGARGGIGGAVHDFVGYAVFDGFFREEPFIAVEIAVDLLGFFISLRSTIATCSIRSECRWWGIRK